MDSDEILSAYVGISQLMNVGHFGAGNRTHRTCTTSVVTQTFFSVEREIGFPHQALLHTNDSVRAVVIVNRRLLAWAPADHQHLDGCIATNSMAPVIAFLETAVRLEVEIADLDIRNPVVQLFKGWWTGLAVQAFD